MQGRSLFLSGSRSWHDETVHTRSVYLPVVGVCLPGNGTEWVDGSTAFMGMRSTEASTSRLSTLVTKQPAPQRHEWKAEQPFRDVRQLNLRTLAASGDGRMLDIRLATDVQVTMEQISKSHEWKIVVLPSHTSP
jgi:hypothetical protein